MKKITISANEDLIKRARKTAQSLGKTLEEAIIEWLESYARKEVSAQEYDALMKRLRRTVRSAGPYTRDEMNER
ncbi:MAG TPA: type II toxin-antitoxin system CcdA family antitoxin [Verrucomicrobiae bacterium]|nr:type II toxin-antitoxin system CcdA family antitoxin [Verrucomicrobiae bacterium]